LPAYHLLSLHVLELIYLDQTTQERTLTVYTGAGSTDQDSKDALNVEIAGIPVFIFLIGF